MALKEEQLALQHMQQTFHLSALQTLTELIKVLPQDAPSNLRDKVYGVISSMVDAFIVPENN